MANKDKKNNMLQSNTGKSIQEITEKAYKILMENRNKRKMFQKK